MAGAVSPAVDNLVAQLTRLPGIGTRTAQRLAFHLLRVPKDEALALAAAIEEVKERVRFCRECGNLTEEELCAICLDARRDHTIICVVEQPVDLLSLERTHEYRGLYHVLGGALSPLDGVEPEHLRIDELLRRVERNGVEEVVLATNPNMTGEATAAYLADRLRGRVRVTRLASGLPVGGDLEYADEVTLGRALSGRREMWTLDAMSETTIRGGPRGRAGRAARSRGHRRDEVRRHVGRRHGEDQARRPRLVDAREEGNRVVAVLSAMGDTTDELIRLAHEVSPQPHPREHDMLISVGERISSALAAMAIHDLGHEAISLTGSQAGIVTDTVHGKAKIVEVRAKRIHDALDAEKIVLVAGFQGVSTDFDVTTLGRGGSDLTAVALAAALGADACEIYTDVEGVFTADPRVVPERAQAPRGHLRGDARAGGVRREGAPATLGRVRAQPRREAARALDVLRRRGNVDRRRGGRRCSRRRSSPASRTPTRDRSTACRGIDAARLFERSRRRSVNVDTILQTAADEIVFSAPIEDRAAAEDALGGLDVEWSMRDDLGKVSLVGAGMKSHPGIAAQTFATLGDLGVEPDVISTSPIKIACHVRTEDVERAWTRCTTPSSSDRRARNERMTRIGVVGATGAVGIGDARPAAERGYENVRAFASARSAGTRSRTAAASSSRGGDGRGARRGRPRPRLFSVGTRRRASSSPTRSRAARSSSTSRRVPARPTASRSSCPR